MLSVIIDINKEFISDNFASPEAKGLLLFLSIKKEIDNTVRLSKQIFEQLLEDESLVFYTAITELLQKNYLEITYTPPEEVCLEIKNFTDVKKYIFGIN